MKGKKILSLFLSFVMVISVVAGLDITTAFADTSEDGDWTYTISDDGTAVITAYNGSDTEITIPATVDGYTVTEVGFSSNSGSNSTITSITISEGITTLSTYAFRSYTALESVSLPSTLTAISNFAFQNCYVLTGVTIPEAVTSIGNYSFQNCYALTEIIIPAAVTSLGTSAFYNCTSLEYVLILSETATIGNTCFRYDSALTTLISVSSGSVTNNANTITSTSVVLYGLSGSYLNTLATSRSKTFVAIDYTTVEPDCINDGIMTITVSEDTDEAVLEELELSVGDVVFEGTYAKALGHSYESVITKAPCIGEGDGVITYTCSVCGDTYAETIAAQDHSYVETLVSATCTKNPRYYDVCEYCGYKVFDRYLTDDEISEYWDIYEAFNEAFLEELLYEDEDGEDFLSDFLEYYDITEEQFDDMSDEMKFSLYLNYFNYIVSYTVSNTGLSWDVAYFNEFLTGYSFDPNDLAFYLPIHDYDLEFYDADCEYPSGIVFVCQKCGDYEEVITSDEAFGHGYANVSYSMEDVLSIYDYSSGDEETDAERYSYLEDEDAKLDFWTVFTVCYENADENGDEFEQLCYDYMYGYTNDDGEEITGLLELLHAYSFCYEFITLDEISSRYSKYENAVENAATMLLQVIGDNYIDEEGAKRTLELYGVDNDTLSGTFYEDEYDYEGYQYDFSIYSVIFSTATGKDVSTISEIACYALGIYTDYTEESLEAGFEAVEDCAQELTLERLASLGYSYDADNYLFYTVEKTVDPTCTEGGYTKYECLVCGQTYIDDYTDATGHSYVATTTDPTCTEYGYTTYTCSGCGETYVDDYIDATGHSYVATTTDPTCVSVGYTTYTCSVCGDTYVNDIVEATGHTYIATVTEPSCVSAGYTTYTCSVCGDTYTGDFVDATGHNYTADVTEPTCTEYGYTTYTCTACGDSYVSDFVEPTGHTYDDGTVTTEATCTEEGVMTYTCTVCGDTYTEAIAVIDHSYTSEVTDPTCTEYGYTTYICSVCGDSYTADYTQATGHNYTTELTDPTCTEYGYTTYTCSVCGDSYVSDYVEATGHTYDDGTITTEATCTDEGVMTYTCTVCGDTYTEAIAVIEHSYTAVVTDPTCTEYGYTTYTCTVCGDSYTADYTQATGHTAVIIEATAPTCEETGLTAGAYCSVCGAVIVEQEEVEATGHSFTNYISNDDATCTQDGTKTAECDNGCGLTDTVADEGSATGHSYEWVIASNNYPTKTCSACGDVKVILAFTDISTETEYFDYIAYTSYYNSLITGVKANSTDTTTETFSPRTSLTRAMLVTILYRMAGSPYDDANPYTTTPFSDVKAGTWYYNAVCWALDNGITTETKFKPNTAVTREQTATFLYRYAGEYLGEDVSTDNDISSYPDASSVSAYAQTAMAWANDKGMITGTQQGYLNPQGTTLRVHATKILYNFGVAYNVGEFEE